MRNITNIFASLRAAYTNRTDPEGMQLLARTYWRIVLSISTILAIFAIGFGVMQLFEVLATFSSRPTSDVILPITLDRGSLEKALAAFDARRKAYELVPSATSTFPDPSRSF